MSWITAALLASYIGICEWRAPTPWQTCENRWSLAMGVLVPSPLPAATGAIARHLSNRRRRHDAEIQEPKL